jgi:hypothetical protein
MPSPLFEFFEIVAEELCAGQSRVLTRANLEVHDQQAPVLDELKSEMGASTTEDAIRLAVGKLQQHFAGKGSALPFEYDALTGRFTALDRDFLTFIKQMRQIRSLGKRSRDFECSVAQRLHGRATGSIHRVGSPQDSKRLKADFNAYLKTLGFAREVRLGQDKDGGFDILWLLPLGSIPHRPIVSVQCKNGEFDVGEADRSVGAGKRSFSQHGGLMPDVHVPCVLFNDYISPQQFTGKQLNFVPLGLTDLSTMLDRQPAVEFI